ncbi:mannose-1-phosphate guanylyltransferase [Fonticella tunisiensis]|uniref:mannose-1-phosphate guanylyltransferase n=1 Tax=Fonticella tunisiensis TaxID=1096341 RepID=A0A4R7K6Q7_9CLOT|nr:mannose-1-phosphate guanylyltransferase [Fonticella tunisiensis]TDT46088.1 mannose-1-phosphate guanylyltransferase (GDP) [Fonticella tunisiensis]
MLCGLIMAGGKGERFWPLSTEEKPKQFLNLLGEDTMIQMTVKRLGRLIPIERIFVVTAERYVKLVKEQLPNLPERNIIVEPVGKNTAPCIALSAFTVEKYYGDATLVVVPSDHLIKDVERFIRTIGAAASFVESKEDAIVTLGIKPDRPETGYGYIKYNNLEEKIDGLGVNSVERFVEKPNLETAQKYLNEGNYLWNSGMFIWKVSTIKKHTQTYLPDTYEVIDEIAASVDMDDFEDVLRQKYSEVESISVDYGIMEKAENIYVIPSDFGWDDVGSWSSVERYSEKDEDNNVSIGHVKYIESRNNLVIGNGKKVAVVGLEDIFIIDTDDVILIGKKDLLNDIKNIKEQVNN